jgi:ankyrin repeat protein
MSSSLPTPEEIRDFVIAGHGNLTKVKQILAVRPELLNVAFEWGPGDTETALQGASHVGSREVAEYLLAQGAPMEICTAAMLGRQPEVEHFLQDDPELIHSHGAHRIPLLTHAALSGNVELVEMLATRGATSGLSMALSLAVNKGHVNVTRWLLENGSPDLTWKNFQGKTALEVATDRGSAEIIDLLKIHGATT